MNDRIQPNSPYRFSIDCLYTTKTNENMTKIDPHKNKEKYLKWKQRAHSSIADLSEYNQQLFMRYMSDMESGLNVASNHKKGSRSYIRLNTIRIRLHYLMRETQEKFKIDKFTDLKEEHIHQYFLKMRNGEIRKKDGFIFKSVKDYVQDFKAFWHWWQKVNRKQGIEVLDITTDLDTSCEKPKWVYLTEEEVNYSD